jgi:hypothetical protein
MFEEEVSFAYNLYCETKGLEAGINISHLVLFLKSIGERE